MVLGMKGLKLLCRRAGAETEELPKTVEDLE